jgi:virulence-associated protein VagC
MQRLYTNHTKRGLTMQAIELNAVITQNHEIHLKLPDDVKASHAKVIVMYENSLKDDTKRLAKKWDQFFASKSVFDDDFLAERDNEIPQEREFY